jgi:hypothetical protein
MKTNSDIGNNLTFWEALVPAIVLFLCVLILRMFNLHKSSNAIKRLNELGYKVSHLYELEV